MKKLFALICCLFCFTAISPAKEKLPPKNEKIAPHALVIFGATGDLTKRKLMPGLLQLFKKGELPDSFVCIGVGRRVLSDEEFRKDSGSFIAKEDRETWGAFSKKISYLHGSYEEEKSYVELAKRIKPYANRLFYLATPEAGFSPIIKQLGSHELLKEQNNSFSRVMIEKPFGHDLDSAQRLQQEIAHYAKENQVFRVDHYLAKNMVDELVNFRFSNPLIEMVWNRQFIDHVSITLSEEAGVETRGSFWEQTGLLRDIVQNHAMQLLSLIAMEKPANSSSEELRKAKTKAIQSIRSFPLDHIDETIIRGQYGPGNQNGKPVPGYRQEMGVSPHSNIETFVAAQFFIDNERWNGVPFYLKAGKRLNKKEVEVAITFKSPVNQTPNQLIFRIQPNEQISFMTYPLSFKTDPIQQEAYEKLFREAMTGNSSHFVSFEELEASWQLLNPVLEYWQNPSKDFPNYRAGSDGLEIKKKNTNSSREELVLK
ncbi:MAG TPA: glucose-6-phosphate dehydrogenase [Rhabdochlamydiaceae bacterium]|nr:glucose-6-phosphate dehydrogenase [Rhabdochlamydiaceae bacterium]